MYNSFQLDEINFSDLTLTHKRESVYNNQDHARWVYYDKNNNLYYKLWNPTYIRKDNVVNGIKSGFYDSSTTPALKGIISYENVCRGYVMEGVKENNQNSKPFYSIIKEKTKTSKHFYFDYCNQHIMEYKNQFCLIDLEGIYPLSELQNFLDHKYNSSFADNNYKEFVCNLVK